MLFMKNLKIERLTEEFVDEVALIENELIGSSSNDTIRKTIESETLDYYLLFVENELVGFFEVSIITPEAELFDIAVKKEFQGKGYGTILMQEFLKLVSEKMCDTVFLEVNNINNKAIALYKKFGFKQYDVRKNYYGDNDAILMKLQM